MFEPREMDRWRRQLSAMLDHAGADDPEGFAQVVGLLDWAQGEGLRSAAATLRQPHGVAPGYSWAELARGLRVTRSAVAQRFRQR
jgi:hypothetical protein